MESGQGRSGLPDLDCHSEMDTANESTCRTANASDSRCSPTTLAESSPPLPVVGSTQPNECSATNPKDDIDLLDDVISRVERNENGGMFGVDNGGCEVGESNPNAGDSSRVADVNCDDSQVDSDAEKRVIDAATVRDIEKNDFEKESVEESAKNDSEHEGTDAQDSKAFPDSQDYAMGFEMSETFLDNLNPQDDSQEEPNRMCESEQEAESTFPHSGVEVKLSNKETEAASPRTEETEDISLNIEEKVVLPHSIDEKGEICSNMDERVVSQDDKEEKISFNMEDKVLSPQNIDAREEISSNMEEKVKSHGMDEKEQEISSIMEQRVASPQNIDEKERSPVRTENDRDTPVLDEEPNFPKIEENSSNMEMEDMTFASIEDKKETSPIMEREESSCRVEDGEDSPGREERCEEAFLKFEDKADKLSLVPEEMERNSPETENREETSEEGHREVLSCLENEQLDVCVKKDGGSSSPTETGEEPSNDSEERHGAAPSHLEEEPNASFIDDDQNALPTEDGEIQDEGDVSGPSSPEMATSASDPDDSQGADASDILQLSAELELEIREEEGRKKEHSDKDNSSGDDVEKEDDRDEERNGHRDSCDVHESSPKADDDSYDDKPDDLCSREVKDKNCEEEDSRSNDDKSERQCRSQDSQDENFIGAGSEEGIDIMETSVDLDEREYSAEATVTSVDSQSKRSPALGVTQVIQCEEKEGAEEEDSRTVQENEEDSDDDVQIIEVPPEPIDTLIVDDDDDEDDVVPTTSSRENVKVPVSELNRSSKKKRTVEQDGHDLRIVLRDDRRDRDDLDRHRRRHEKDRREERRSDSHRRSESDRRSPDRSSRRRHHRSRTRSRERRRRRSRSRSHSRDRSSRRRRHRERSRERSQERERSSRKRRRHDRSREHRRRSRSRSNSPAKQTRADSWDKENHDEHVDHEVVEQSKSKKRHYRRQEDKKEESPEVKRNSRKRDDSPVVEKTKRRRPARTWSPSDTFQKDPSDTPTPGRSPAEKSEAESEERETNTNRKDSQREVVLTGKEEKEKEEPAASPEHIAILPEDIPIPDPVNIPVPQAKTIPVPEPVNAPVPENNPIFQSTFFQEPEQPLPEPPVEELLQPPVPEEEPMENPPEPPPLPPRRLDGLPVKGEGLLPTPIRRRAALEEAVYDPAHPTDEETDRFIFPGMQNPPRPPHPDIIGGPPHPGQLMSDGTFVVPAPSEGGLLGLPPQRVPLQPVAFSPNRPMFNPVVIGRPPFSNGPFPSQLPAPPPGTRFASLPLGGPGAVIQLQNQFGQQLPPGPPPPPPERFPGQLTDMFEDGPPPMHQFPGHAGMPEIPNLAGPPGPPPSEMHIIHHPHRLDSAENGGPLEDDSNLVAGQNFRDKFGVDQGSVLPHSVFKLPLPPGHGKPGKLPLPSVLHTLEERGEDSTEVMDMDMSPLDEECELELSSPPDVSDIRPEAKGKKLNPLATIDLKKLSNAIKKLTSQAGDDLPTSAVEMTNNEKYMKKLHLQERVVDEVKQALRPFYTHKKITKEEYKDILRRAVPKVCHSKSGNINPVKIQQLVKGYVGKYQKHRSEQSDKVTKPTKAAFKDKGKANGEHSKSGR